jgi:hypothetical protein
LGAAFTAKHKIQSTKLIREPVLLANVESIKASC